MKDITGSTGGEGGRVLSFRKKRKNQRKVVYVFLPQDLLSSGVLGELYIGSIDCFLSSLARFKSQRRFLLPKYVAHASYNLT